jgi:hypothetical protein
MKIPQSPIDLKVYHQTIIDLLNKPGVPIYVDASLLMWLLQAGDVVRRELLQWCENVVSDRVFVPTWSAHELYRHIRQETVLKDVQGRLKQYNATFRQALIDMAVSADDALCEQTQFNDRSHLLQTLRADVVRLSGQLSEVLESKKVQSHYQRALTDVIAFVNKHVTKTDPFDLFAMVGASKDLRFSGRVPPGYKDEGKGENSVGDLVFWEEVLAHVTITKSIGAVILTNDNKSDWHYKPSQLLNYKGERRAVQQQSGFEAHLPHPLLEHEAYCKAGIEDLVILDVSILAVVLDRTTPLAVRALVAATHPTLLEKYETGVNWSQIDPAGSEVQLRNVQGADALTMPVAASPRPRVVTEDEAAQPVPVIFLRDEGSVPTALAPYLRALEADVTERTAALDTVMSPSFLKDRTRQELVILGRRVYRTAAAKGSPADVRIAEFLQMASGLDVSLSNALALGMFVELYFDEALEIRPTPLDGPWQVLFDMQYQEVFCEAVEQIAEMLAPQAEKLLAVPSCNPKNVEVQIQLVKPAEKGTKHIASVIIRGKELLGDAIPMSSSSMTTLVGGRPSTIGAVMHAISRRFVVPLRQLVSDKDQSQPISWPDHVGLRLMRLDHGGVCDELSLSFQGGDS